MANIVSQVISAASGIFPGLRVRDNNAADTTVRPWDVGTLGSYRLAAISGQITGTAVVNNAPLFSLRWADPNRLMVITRLRASLNVITLFSAAQELQLDAKVARAFTVADTAGTAITLTGNDNKVKASQGTSLLTAGGGDCRIAAATLLTLGTRTLDTNSFAFSPSVWDRHVNPAAATAELPLPPQAILDFAPNMAAGEWPIVLAQNEGILVRNAGPTFATTGVVRLVIETLAWNEVAAWP